MWGRRVVLTLSLMLALETTPVLAVEDWPGWRGSSRGAVAEGFQQPDSWPESLNRKWRVSVGEGHSSPVTAEDRIFQFTRLDDQETITGLDQAGQILWRKQYAAPYKVDPVAQAHGKGPKATPYVSDGQVYTLGISGILSCWSADRGERLWQREFSGQYERTSPLYGTASSPLVTHNRCLAYVGGHDGGAMTAFDPRKGTTIWQWDGNGPGYSSPILAQLAGTQQIITQAQTQCIGLSLEGELLWSIPYETPYVQNIVTPVVYGDTVIFSGFDRGVTAYRLQKRGMEFTTDQHWHNDQVSLYMSSPVIAAGRLYGFSHRKRGQLFCLDAATGKLLWAGPPRQGKNALLIGTGKALMALTDEGELIVFADQPPQYQQLARYRVAGTPTWAHPVIVNNNLLIKDAEHLSLWSFEP